MRALLTSFVLIGILMLSACKKEDPECPTTQTIDGRNQFVGQYRVYDTLGNYLYMMEIFMSSKDDTLWVSNWGGAFDLYIQHQAADQTNFMNLIPPFPSYDHLGFRWAFSAESDGIFGTNQLIDDTLRMSYRKNNIAFFFDDGVPYFSGSFREYGVKQP